MGWTSMPHVLLGSLAVVTQPHSHTQPHRYTGTQAHRHTATQAHNHTATQPHRHTATQPHSQTQPCMARSFRAHCTLTFLQRHHPNLIEWCALCSSASRQEPSVEGVILHTTMLQKRGPRGTHRTAVSRTSEASATLTHPHTHPRTPHTACTYRSIADGCKRQVVVGNGRPCGVHQDGCDARGGAEAGGGCGW